MKGNKMESFIFLLESHQWLTFFVCGVIVAIGCLAILIYFDSKELDTGTQKFLENQSRFN